MANFEYCELWWSEGYRPQLTYYKPMGAENVALEHDKGADADAWEAFQLIVAELGYSGWQLVSASHHSAGLLFMRSLQ
ncbi:MAG: hypothetical protein ACYC66_12000 [Chloroflexota bacterium]